MNLSHTIRLGDYLTDHALASEESREAQQERRQRYVNKRSEEIYERRTGDVSSEDFVLAFEILHTQRMSVARLMDMIYGRDDPTAQELRAMVSAALLKDSIDIAIAEFRALEAEPPSQERH